MGNKITTLWEETTMRVLHAQSMYKVIDQIIPKINKSESEKAYAILDKEIPIWQYNTYDSDNKITNENVISYDTAYKLVRRALKPSKIHISTADLHKIMHNYWFTISLMNNFRD